MDWVAENWSTLVTAAATVTLVIINCRLLKKYDKQRKIDIFYHSFYYRKELRDEIKSFLEVSFECPILPNKVPSLPWKYSGKGMSKDSIFARKNAKEYKEILSKLEDASGAFPKQREKVEGFIALLKNLDDAIRLYNWKQNDKGHLEKFRNAYGKVCDNTKLIKFLEEDLKFPTD
ncbi:MAG: hypothetical protein GY915_06840 [bacterium]|nr:hypothetical protein [bacterium]